MRQARNDDGGESPRQSPDRIPAVLQFDAKVTGADRIRRKAFQSYLIYGNFMLPDDHAKRTPRCCIKVLLGQFGPLTTRWLG